MIWERCLTVDLLINGFPLASLKGRSANVVVQTDCFGGLPYLYTQYDIQNQKRRLKESERQLDILTQSYKRIKLHTFDDGWWDFCLSLFWLIHVCHIFLPSWSWILIRILLFGFILGVCRKLQKMVILIHFELIGELLIIITETLAYIF